MRDKYLLRFLNTWNNFETSIPTEVLYSEACYQRDIFRGKLQEYLHNNKDKHYLPSFRPHDYVPLIMQNIGERTNSVFPMYNDTTYRHPQPAYLVLAAWLFLIATDAKMNKFWEKNLKDAFMEYLKMCSSMEGICDSLIQHLHDWDEAQQPITLFDIPTTPVTHPTNILPSYNLHLVSNNMNEIYYPGSNHQDYRKTVNIGSINAADAQSLIKDFLKDEPEPTSQPHSSEPTTTTSSYPLWQQILIDFAVPDEQCREAYGWHNTRIAMYLRAMEELHLYNITERQGSNAQKFYQTLSSIFGYGLVQHTIEDNLNHILDSDKNKHIYESEILPLVKNQIK